MSKEFELFSLDGFGGWFRRTKPHPFVLQPGQACLNCQTELAGRYCHACGQDADTHHRSIVHLLFEAFEGLFHLDGRIWQTLPALFFAPGKLGRDLIEGRMARHVPPFRIFLVALLVFMFAAEWKTEALRHDVASGHTPAHQKAVDDVVKKIEQATPDGPADLKPHITVNSPQTQASNVVVREKTLPDGTVDREVTRNIQIFAMSEEDAKVLADLVRESNIQPAWLKADLLKALDHQEGFFHALFTWGHRLALLLLPIIGVSLGLLYRGKKHKRFFLYDHLLVGMNLLSFVFLTTAISLVLPNVFKPWSELVFAAWTLVTFFLTLRGAYGSSTFGAILKSIVLWAMTGLSFGILILLVMFISLTAG